MHEEIILTLSDLEPHFEELFDKTEHNDALLGDAAADLQLTSIVSSGQCHEEKCRWLVARVDASTGKDLIEETVSRSLPQILRQNELLIIAKVEVFRDDAPSRCLCGERDCVARLLAALPFLIVIGIDPYVGDVIVEYLTEFVHNTSSDLRADLRRGYEATDALDFAFVD